MMVLVTLSSVSVEKVESTGGGESGEMCCDFREVGKVEHIFSIFSENSTNLSARNQVGFIDGSFLAGSQCNTSPRTRHNFLGS